MVDLLIDTLAPLGYPIKLQGSLAPDEPAPDHFFTYWNNAADGTSFYSDDEHAIDWQFSLNFYSVDPANVYSVLTDAKKLLKSAGFIVTGAGYSLASDDPSHTGRGFTIHYRQEL